MAKLSRDEAHVALAVVVLCDVILRVGSSAQFLRTANMLEAAIRTAGMGFQEFVGLMRKVSRGLSSDQTAILASMWVATATVLTAEASPTMTAGSMREFTETVYDVGLDVYVSLSLAIRNAHDEVCEEHPHLNPRKRR